jgi:hypothetical protein
MQHFLINNEHIHSLMYTPYYYCVMKNILKTKKIVLIIICYQNLASIYNINHKLKI